MSIQHFAAAPGQIISFLLSSCVKSLVERSTLLIQRGAAPRSSHQQRERGGETESDRAREREREREQHCDTCNPTDSQFPSHVSERLFISVRLNLWLVWQLLLCGRFKHHAVGVCADWAGLDGVIKYLHSVTVYFQNGKPRIGLSAALKYRSSVIVVYTPPCIEVQVCFCFGFSVLKCLTYAHVGN